MPAKKKKPRVDSGDARMDDEKGEQAITKQARERAFAEGVGNSTACDDIVELRTRLLIVWLHTVTKTAITLEHFPRGTRTL